MPFNETAVYMEKHSKHESSSGSTRESKLSSPTVQCMGKPIDNPLIKYQGCKWEQVFDFDKILKQIRNAERYYLRGKHEHIPQAGSSKSNSGCSFPRREQPQVQRLSSTDMHFYGMVPKQPFDVVVCDICLGIYTKMGFNNHMKIHHPQAWNLISSKASTSKDSAHNVASAGTDNLQDNVRELSASTNLSTEQQAAATTSIAASSNSRHKSSKSSSGGGGSSGGSSRSRSKSKHHHHHHQQQTQQRSSSASAVTGNASTHASQTSSTNAEMSASSTGIKSSKKATSGLSILENKINLSVTVPKEMQQSDIQPIPLFSSTSSNSNNSLPPTLKASNADLGGIQQDSVYPSAIQAAKDKPKASKRKSKNISLPLSLPPPESNESSNSSVEYTAAVAAAAAAAAVAATAAAAAATAAATSNVVKPSLKRCKPKGGKDLKQLMEPQLSELDKAISSITEGHADVLNETSNSNDNDCGRNVLKTPITNCTTALGYNTEEATLPMQTQVPIASTRQQQHSHYGAMPMLPENTNSSNIHQQQIQQQRSSNAEDNDNSILTLEDMLDSKFIHEILNTEESEIHFDESELDKAAQQQQQQQQQAYLQPTAGKRMRYDDQISNGMGHVETVVQQPILSGKYAAFQQQQQQQQQTQQAFHVTNLEDMKMYTTAIDAQQYLAAQQHQPQQQQHPQQQQEHQITTIDPMQLQQLLYQQQHQQGLNSYTVGNGLDEVTAALEQQHYNDSDVIMCSAEQLHKEGKINAADYATLAALSGNNNTYGNVANNVCDVNAIAAAAQFQVYNIPSLTDDDIAEDASMVESKLNDVIIPQNHYVLPAEGNDEEQLIYEITANNQVAVISQQRQQQMIAEFLTQAGYDSVDNVNVNLDSGTVLAEDGNETKYSTHEVDINNELLDFDYSRLETVKSCSSSSSSVDSKSAAKVERNNKFISPTNTADDLFLNVFLYTGLPRPMAVNSFGLCKLPQGVATTFRKNLHATRKANNSPISLSGNGGATATTRFSSNVPNTKPTASQNYFTALGANTNSGNAINEFSIGSITITNQAHQTPNNNNNNSLIQQQQQMVAQKQGLMVQTPVEFSYNASTVNGLITTSASATSPPVSNMHATANTRPSSRPKSAGGANSGSSQSKQKYGSSSSSSNNAVTLPLPQNQAKTIVVNASNVATANADQIKFIKRSLISKTNLPSRNYMNFTTKQLSEILLHPSKEKYMQLIASKDQDKDATTTGISPDQQRLNNVRHFYERRKRLLNTTATANGYNHVRQLNSQQPPTTTVGLKQKFLRQRLLRTLSDCGINSIKTNSNSANNSSNNDILRVS